MKRTFAPTLRLPAAALACLLLGAPQAFAQPDPEARRLHEVMERYLEAELELYPVFATSIGEHRYDDRYSVPIGEPHRARQRAHYASFRRELDQFQPSRLAERERLHFEVFRRALERRLAGLSFDGHLQPVTQLGGAPVDFPLLGSGRGLHPFKRVADYDNFLKRIEGFVEWIDTAIANMRRGVERGIVQPRVVMQRTLPQLEALIVDEPARSFFYQPVLQMPAAFSEAERARLTAAYAQAIAGSIVPAYRKLRDFIREEYLPRARSSVAYAELPNGNAWYDHLVRVHTTTDLTPEAIFQLGHHEIARIGKEMERMREARGFRGTPREFARHLSDRAPPGHTSREDLIKGYEAIRAIVTPQLPRLFGHLPRAPYEIRTIAPFRERAAPSQYWSAAPDGSRPGIFYVNAAGIGERALRASESLFLHEAVPGHHLQISIQRERQDLPRFRRFDGYTAFIEGWALYAEGLGQELGLYAEPQQNHGRLGSELFRAVRLVVDVGLHRKGWSREQALKFMLEVLGGSEAGALQEIDRYIANPGQALAYKIGQLRISAIRSKAEQALGARFDIRAFHDELLKDGALPLDLLEAKMDAWLERAAR